MQLLEFQNMMTRIYALFGKVRPHNDILKGIYDSVKNIPDTAIPGIIEKFEEMPELKAGVNMARLINSFYTVPQNNEKFHCQYCNDRGYFWGIQETPDGCYSDFTSLCPNCTGRGGNCETYSEMLRRGAMVMPPNYKGSIYAWAKEKYGIELHKSGMSCREKENGHVF